MTKLAGVTFEMLGQLVGRDPTWVKLVTSSILVARHERVLYE